MSWNCTSCGHQNEDTAVECWDCGELNDKAPYDVTLDWAAHGTNQFQPGNTVAPVSTYGRKRRIIPWANSAIILGCLFIYQSVSNLLSGRSMDYEGMPVLMILCLAAAFTAGGIMVRIRQKAGARLITAASYCAIFFNVIFCCVAFGEAVALAITPQMAARTISATPPESNPSVTQLQGRMENWLVAEAYRASQKSSMSTSQIEQFMQLGKIKLEAYFAVILFAQLGYYIGIIWAMKPEPEASPPGTDFTWNR